MSSNPMPKASHASHAAPLIPAATHRSETDLPFVTVGEGVDLQVLHTDVKAGLWVIRMRAQPGVTLQQHKHTGEVFAFTLRGSWKYLEYPEINTAGSYLHEPAGSVHTLHVPTSNEGVTDIWFAIRGANLNLDAEGKVESLLDASSVLELYLAACREARLSPPDVISG